MYNDQFPQHSAQFRQQQNMLTVTEEGSIQAQPDIAVVTLGTRTENKQATVAQTENTAIISSLIQSLQQLGISPNDIQTIDYHIDMQYDYIDGKQILRGYQVIHLLEITIKQIKQTGALIDAAVNSGANVVSNIRFTLSQQEVYYNQALALALKNAQHKARVVADTLKVTLNEIPIKITEISQTIPPSPYQVASFTKTEGTPMMPGQIQIKATINAKFVYYF